MSQTLSPSLARGYGMARVTREVPTPRERVGGSGDLKTLWTRVGRWWRGRAS
jgi:hypothetical protein